jgi:hypothetical protein
LANSKQLAISEAVRQGADTNIVLATIEAETGFTNMMGDNGKAYGYGQVWYMWWSNNFDYAASVLKLQLPTDTDDLATFVLNNDAFSMILAVKTIKDIWLSKNKNWHEFTLAYVGNGIPQSDYNRRLAIWNKYNNNSVVSNYSSTAQNGNSGSVGGLVSPYDDKVFEPTNFQIVKNSLTNGNILWGRKYRVLVNNAHGVALDVSQLRCTFKVNKNIQMQPNLSEITIYNLNVNTENTIIQEGNEIILEAGYEGENQYGMIFRGQIIQPIRDKEDNVTYRLKLTSLDGDAFLNYAIVGDTYIRGQTKRDMIENLTSRATISSELGSISENLSNQQLTRGKVVFGLARDYLRQIAQFEQASFYVEDGKAHIVKMDDIPNGETIELSPASGLIGTPVQAEYGVQFKSLLNPRIKIGTLVHIDNSLVREAQFTPNLSLIGQQATLPNNPFRQLDSDGIYKVISLDHIGDTRGDPWYTECNTVCQQGKIPQLINNPTANPFG